MTDEEVLSEFRHSEALLEGQFLLSSGRHSGHYLQCARVLMNAERAARLALSTGAEIFVVEHGVYALDSGAEALLRWRGAPTT